MNIKNMAILAESGKKLSQELEKQFEFIEKAKTEKEIKKYRDEAHSTFAKIRHILFDIE